MDEKDDLPSLGRITTRKKLVWKRLPEEGWYKGVCAGLAKSFGWKPGRVRAAMIFATLLLAGFPALLYLAAAVSMPAEDSK